MALDFNILASSSFALAMLPLCDTRIAHTLTRLFSFRFTMKAGRDLQHALPVS